MHYELSENPILGFELLGLVKITSDHTFFLLPRAFNWAAYERKSRLGKWLVRLPNIIKDFMIALSFFASLVLVILQILEHFKILRQL
jgi:hypothetical protein